MEDMRIYFRVVRVDGKEKKKRENMNFEYNWYN